MSETEDITTSEPDLDEMTKAELLEHAKELGVTPANNDMTKDELRAAIEEHQGGPGVEGQATSTASKDYMGRALITPSVNSKDYLGRATSSALDYMGRTLVM
jgi:hypothetical protein